MGAKEDDHNTLFFGYHFKISCKLNVCDQTGVRGCHKEVGILFSVYNQETFMNGNAEIS